MHRLARNRAAELRVHTQRRRVGQRERRALPAEADAHAAHVERHARAALGLQAHPLARRAVEVLPEAVGAPPRHDRRVPPAVRERGRGVHRRIVERRGGGRAHDAHAHMAHLDRRKADEQRERHVQDALRHAAQRAQRVGPRRARRPLLVRRVAHELLQAPLMRRVRARRRAVARARRARVGGRRRGLDIDALDAQRDAVHVPRRKCLACAPARCMQREIHARDAHARAARAGRRRPRQVVHAAQQPQRAHMQAATQLACGQRQHDIVQRQQDDRIQQHHIQQPPPRDAAHGGSEAPRG